MNEQGFDIPISAQEAELLFGKSKKVVWYAIQKGKLLARQSVCSENWMISLNSCIALWGLPVMAALTDDIRKEWANEQASISSQSRD